jgi:hypothetical protein
VETAVSHRRHRCTASRAQRDRDQGHEPVDQPHHRRSDRAGKSAGAERTACGRGGAAEPPESGLLGPVTVVLQSNADVQGSTRPR